MGERPSIVQLRPRHSSPLLRLPQGEDLCTVRGKDVYPRAGLAELPPSSTGYACVARTRAPVTDAQRGPGLLLEAHVHLALHHLDDCGDRTFPLDPLFHLEAHPAGRGFGQPMGERVDSPFDASPIDATRGTRLPVSSEHFLASALALTRELGLGTLWAAWGRGLREKGRWGRAFKPRGEACQAGWDRGSPIFDGKDR